MRNYPEGEKTFSDFLREVRERALKAYENQDYQFEELIERLRITRDLSRNPLFDTMFVLQNMEIQQIKLDRLDFIPYPYQSKVAKFDLTLYAREDGHEIEFELEYSTKLFKTASIKNFVNHFIQLMKGIVDDVGLKLKDLEILTETEKDKLFFDFNKTKTEYPIDKGIHQLFEEQVEKTPDHIALVFGETCLTYRELNNRANTIAWYLRGKGIGEDKIVGIMVERSLEMIIGILGILKAGGAYVPIDPGYPKERINYLLESSKTAFLLSGGMLEGLEVAEHTEVIDIGEVLQETKMPCENPDIAYNPERLMYVLYTSGSTGNPKGVMVKTHAFVNLLNWFTKEFDINDTDNILLIAPASFDLAQKNLYATLIKGGRLTLFAPGMYDYNHMSEVIQKEEVTIINCTPSAFQPLVDFNIDTGFERLKSLRYIYLGGEPINLGKLMPWVESPNYHGEIVNTYGPTECTDIASFYRIGRDEMKTLVTVPIGKPIHNTRLYVLDRHGSLLPIGTAGELCIGGTGLARGYYNAEELTAERFVKCSSIPEEMIYKTGDLVKWLPDGDIEFLGRLDHQVKIRGFRIELGEIEAGILKFGSVNEVVVTAKEDRDGNKYLCAYMVAEGTLNTLALKEHLTGILPDHMVPSHFIVLEKMPLTPNGKIDRKALPEPEYTSLQATEYIAPASRAEKKLGRLWQEVLGVEQVGMIDNFFDLGGHSLKAAVLVSKIRKGFEVDIPISEIFKAPTIRELTASLEVVGNSVYSMIEKVGQKEYYPVSSAQKRIFIVSKLEPDSVNYNMFGVMSIQGKLDIEKVEHCFVQLIERHEILRTTFKMSDGEPVQIVHPHVDFSIEHLQAREDEIQEVINDFIRPFDLERTPLLRAATIKICEEKHYLLFDMHHIISDGISLGVLIQDFSKIYNGESLQELSVQYKDYSAWHNRILQSDVYREQKEYWLKNLEDFQYTQLLGRSMNSNKKAGGNTKRADIDMELCRKIDDYCKKNRVTKYVFLLTAFNAAILGEVDRKDIIVGTPVSGRGQSELESLIGVFLNVLAIRSMVDEGANFKEYMKKVNKAVNEALDNQDYPYDELYAEIKKKYSLNEESLFSILFNYLPYQENRKVKIEGLEVEPYELERLEPKYDITVYVNEYEDKMEIKAVYKDHLYEDFVIDRILNNTIQNVRLALEDENRPVVEFNQSISRQDEFFDALFDNEEFFMV
ncbi:MAG: amino acid adenylation domain-containing protein, partial [Clostridia bacterium]|nr:amino acid adenylation domain-containing protein [Clostridia bacterium]